MKKFNSSLPAGTVVVAVDHKYDDNNGAYDVAVLWDGCEVTGVQYANGYIPGSSHDDAEVDATPAQVAEASEWWMVNSGGRGLKLTKGGSRILTGCTAILKRSRKAPNGVPLLITGFIEGDYLTSEQVAVNLEDGEPVWISSGCVETITNYPAPWWA